MLSTGHLDRLQFRVIGHIPHTKSSKSSCTIRRDIGLQRLPSCFDRSNCLPAGGGFVSFTSVWASGTIHRKLCSHNTYCCICVITEMRVCNYVSLPFHCRIFITVQRTTLVILEQNRNFFLTATVFRWLSIWSWDNPSLEYHHHGAFKTSGTCFCKSLGVKTAFIRISRRLRYKQIYTHDEV